MIIAFVIYLTIGSILMVASALKHKGTITEMTLVGLCVGMLIYPFVILYALFNTKFEQTVEEIEEEVK